jgi:hypothetical protein
MKLNESEEPLKSAGKIVNQVDVTLYNSLDKGTIYTLFGGTIVVVGHRGMCNQLPGGLASTVWQLVLVIGSFATLNG